MRPVTGADATVRLVRALVGDVPPGRATTYGDLSRLASDLGGRRVSARTVGRILARGAPGVPWWRVVGHDGRLPPGLETEATRRLLDEGCPMRAGKVDLRRARWAG